jgi:two-component system, OmpR family, sensor kinase
MPQPRSIRWQFAAVFVFFFLLTTALGLFNIAQLSSFNRLSTDVAEVWLPTIRALGDLNNYTSDFRAIEGGNLLAPDAADVAATEKEMEQLDRTIAQAARSFERIRHDPVEDALYGQFQERWNAYRHIVNQMLVLTRQNRKADAVAIYLSESRRTYDAASDTLTSLTDRAVNNARVARDRLAVAYRRMFWLVGLAILVAGAMVVGAVIYVRRVISAPLLQLAARMHSLADHDTITDIPGTDRHDEIGEMARATVVFRKNAVELRRSERLLAAQASLLKEQLAHEQRLTEQQRSFVSMASHEFRTPLTTVDGHARRLIKMGERASPIEVAERAGKIRRAVQRMTQLIENLLSSSRLMDASAAISLETGTLDLAALLHEVAQLHREMTPDARIAERFETAHLPITGDAKLLFQVFSNLLSNAIKYSPHGADIEIAAATSAHAIAVTVTDRGMGIPARDLPHLFERYFRGSNVSGIVGTGIGLYLVKVVVELHGGDIEVQSREDDGARLTVRLPVESRHEMEPHAAPEIAPASPG